jgi:16S rRNA processing protein RimM
MSATRIVVGRISGVYGVKGWVKVYSHTKPLENILRYTPWQLGQHGQWREVKLAEGKPHGKGRL